MAGALVAGGIFWFIACIFFFIVGLCIAIAPLIIWRNTNRTNRLLALLLQQNGVKSIEITHAWNKGGSDASTIFLQKKPAESFKIE